MSVSLSIYPINTNCSNKKNILILFNFLKKRVLLFYLLHLHLGTFKYVRNKTTRE